MGDEPDAPIVLDTGSYSCKAGVGGEDAPRLVVRTLAAYAAGGARPVCYGRDCLDRDPATHEVVRLLTDGRPDADRLVDFWRALAAVDPQLNFSRHAVLASRPALGRFQDTLRVAELFFEELRAPLFHAASDALLALYSSGRVTGLVLACGHEVTAVTPVVTGVPRLYAQTADRFGGAQATLFLQRRLGLGERAAVELKERELRLALDYERRQAEGLKLPDGERVEFETRLCASEAPFQPALVGAAAPGIHEACFASLLKVECDLRRELVNNVLVAGGVGSPAPFSDRLLRELASLLPSVLKARCYNVAEKAHAVWAGGSVLGALASFQPLWISQADYAEQGAACLLRRCA